MVYPNPATRFITIETDGKVESIRFVNITGLESMRIDKIKQGEKIDVSSLPTGIYFVEMLIDDVKVVKRLQKLGI